MLLCRLAACVPAFIAVRDQPWLLPRSYQGWPHVAHSRYGVISSTYALTCRRRRRREVERSQRAAAAAAESAAADAAAAASGTAPPSGLTAGSTQQAWSSTVDALALQGGFRPPNPELSTLALTTGSRLMLEVHSSLAAYICKKLADPATAHLRWAGAPAAAIVQDAGVSLSRLVAADRRRCRCCWAAPLLLDPPAASALPLCPHPPPPPRAALSSPTPRSRARAS